LITLWPASTFWARAEALGSLFSFQGAVGAALAVDALLVVAADVVELLEEPVRIPSFEL
jgi:hypothetical protein